MRVRRDRPLLRLPSGRAMLVVGAALVLLAPGIAAAQALRFTSDFRWFDTGRAAHDIASADFDGDGLLDVVISHPLDGGISILLAAPNGGFRTRVGFDAGPDPHELAVLDADGDGRFDVLVSNRSAGTISWLRGRGDGTFGSPRAFPVGVDPAGALARDFDGDGLVDLVVVAGADLGTVLFLRGTGPATFDTPELVRSGAGPVQLVGVTMPGKRHDALAVAAEREITILSRTPSARFHAIETIPLTASTTGLAAADVDLDGRIDLIVTVILTPAEIADGLGSVQLLRGTASGNFEPTIDLPSDFVPSALEVADVDLDGWPDLLAADRRGGGIGVFPNDGRGNLRGGPLKPSRLGAGRLAAADWNCDGRTDLVGLEPYGRGAVLLPGRGDGGFGDAVAVPLEFGPTDVWLGDLDGDASVDLVLPDRLADRIALFRGNGSPTAFAAGHAIYPTEFGPTRVTGARLRPGGPVDLVVAHDPYDGFLSIGRNQGDGTFAFAADDTVHTVGQPTAFVVADIDANGSEDLVVANHVTSTVTVLLADAAGRLSRRAVLTTEATGLVALAAGRIDGDATVDLVVAAEASHTITVWKGLGTGDFGKGQVFQSGLRPLAITLADLDKDDRLDLVTAQGADYPAPGLVVVYPGDGLGAFGGFATERTVRVGSEPRSIVVADLDGAGRLDVATANSGSVTVSIVPARGGGFTFGESLTLGTGAAADALVAGDVDRDGRTDLVFAGYAADRVGVLLNRTGERGPRVQGATVDILPGTCPNVIDPSSGLVRVALAHGGGFDFADLQVQSARLEGVRATRAGLTLGDETGALDVCGTASDCTCDGRTSDGVPDAIFEFDARAVAAQLAPGAERSLLFEVRLRGGRVIVASDCATLGGVAAPIAGGDSASTSAGGVASPNPLPAGGTLQYAYEIPPGGANVEIGVYTVSGRRIARLAEGFAEAGVHDVVWTARDESGRAIPPGVYFVRSVVAGARRSARVIVLP